MTSISPDPTVTPPRNVSDVQVWQDLRTGLHRCLELDREMSEHCGTARADNAAEAFDREVDTVLEAYSDLVNRGVIGLVEDVLIERGMAGDDATDDAAAPGGAA